MFQGLVQFVIGCDVFCIFSIICIRQLFKRIWKYDKIIISVQFKTTSLSFACSDTDVHTVASLLKLYLRELPVPVVPWTQYHDFLSCTESLDSEVCPEIQCYPLEPLPATK